MLDVNFLAKCIETMLHDDEPLVREELEQVAEMVINNEYFVRDEYISQLFKKAFIQGREAPLDKIYQSGIMDNR